MPIWPFSWLADRRERRRLAKSHAEALLRAEVLARIARAQAEHRHIGMAASILELGGTPLFVSRILAAHGC